MQLILNWVKKYGAKLLIQELDLLEPIIANKMREGQQKVGSVSPETLSKQLIDEIQKKLCKMFEIDPAEVGLK